MSRGDRYRGSLRLLLAASATIWVSHFAAVYLVAEWRCRPGALDGRGDAGDAVTTGIVVALTVVGALAGGRLSDRMGRVRVVGAALVAIAAATALLAATHALPRAAVIGLSVNVSPVK